jgi:glutamine synthetase
MFQLFDQAAKFVDEHQIKLIDLKFCDLWGRWRHLTVPASQFSPSIIEYGIGFDGSAVGLKSVKAGDMVLAPDLSTAFIDPFWEAPTLSFICTVLEADTHQVFANDPRNIAIRAETYLRETGVADCSLWGP